LSRASRPEGKEKKREKKTKERGGGHHTGVNGVNLFADFSFDLLNSSRNTDALGVARPARKKEKKKKEKKGAKELSTIGFSGGSFAALCYVRGGRREKKENGGK